MYEVLVAVAILLAVGFAFILARAAMLPNDFRVSRSTSIKAPREKIFALINDIKAFNQWNPFARMDPSTKTVYGGSVSGLRGLRLGRVGQGR